MKKSSKGRFLGILGGMGPEAGIEFAKILIEKTPARKDQEHLPFLLLNYPKVPDRTAFILGKGPDPVPEIVEGLKIMERAGVSHAVIPCNTAHAFLERIENKTSIFLYNMLQESFLFTKEKLKVKSLGLLATKGTIASGIYEKYFVGFTLIKPESEEEEFVHKAIYEAAKICEMTRAASELKKAAFKLVEKGAEAVILGCTEIETALRKEQFPFPVIKPMEITAEKILKDFKGEK